MDSCGLLDSSGSSGTAWSWWDGEESDGENPLALALALRTHLPAGEGLFTFLEVEGGVEVPARTWAWA